MDKKIGRERSFLSEGYKWIGWIKWEVGYVFFIFIEVLSFFFEGFLYMNF